ncbi:hypothetical protein GCM10010218_19480 [Streptomyces mashuensis]|uniref:Uncharacterized protein n=1 Tax=Streptomyces mashuensis TaxID=33904 RepID=A0A919B2H0_9ACTN|nr:hypothetical protein [Streptomyces mashuensis]GHF38443.1 hypothetical protein GCM10010218_19480 [Streptomyces mashuensis]
MYATYLGDDLVQITLDSDELEAVIAAVETCLRHETRGPIHRIMLGEFLDVVEPVRPGNEG